MAFFDIENFTECSSKPDPAWVENGNSLTKKLYAATMNEYEKIVKTINSGKELKDRERLIVTSKLAQEQDVNKSNFRMDRRPELMQLVNSLNEQLESFYLAMRGRKKSGPKRLKSELEHEVKMLRKKVKELENQNMKSFLEEAIEREILENQRDLYEKLERIQSENKILHNRVANLTTSNQELIRQIAEIMNSSS